MMLIGMNPEGVVGGPAGGVRSRNANTAILPHFRGWPMPPTAAAAASVKVIDRNVTYQLVAPRYGNISWHARTSLTALHKNPDQCHARAT
jgi:hypothetical protein